MALLCTVAIAAAAAFGVYRLRSGSGDAHLRAFFALPTRSSCSTSAPSITVEGSRFSAFVPGRGDVKSVRGKFLIVRYSAPGAAAASLAGHFVLAEASGTRYQPLAGVESAPATPSTGSELVFDVPQDLGAAKLLFDDGCTHQEWIAP